MCVRVLCCTQVLKGEMESLRCDAAWQLAQGQGMVVAVELTPALIEKTFRAAGCPVDCSALHEGVELHRQVRHRPACHTHQHAHTATRVS